MKPTNVIVKKIYSAQAILRGVGSIINIAGNKRQSFTKNDMESLSSDWVKLGDDFRIAMSNTI